MKSKILIATTAALMAAGTYYAVAQGVAQNSQGQAGPKPGQSPMERSAQNERGSDQKGQGGQMNPQGSGRADQVPPGQSRPTTSGQAPSAQPPSGSSTQSPSRPSTSGQAPSSAQQPSTGQSPSGSSTTPQRGGSDTRTQTSPSPRSGTQTAPGAAQQTAPGGSSAQSPTQQGAQGGASGGAAGGTTASLSTEQRTQIRQTVLAQSGAPRVSSVNFSLSVGTVVPRTVRVVVLPEPIIRIHPAWRGYMYFIVGDQIVIVEPGTLRIVAVLA
jgi:hypothetical protein